MVRGRTPEPAAPARLTDEHLASLQAYLARVTESNAFLAAEDLTAIIGELLDAETRFLERCAARRMEMGVPPPSETEDRALAALWRASAPSIGDEGRRRLERALSGLHGLRDSPAVVSPGAGLTLVKTLVRQRSLLAQVEHRVETLQQAVGLPHADGPWRRAHPQRTRRRRR